MAIAKCSCANQGQDQLHGKFNRVMNVFKKGTNLLMRCTVCRKEYAAK